MQPVQDLGSFAELSPVVRRAAIHATIFTGDVGFQHLAGKAASLVLWSASSTQSAASAVASSSKTLLPSTSATIAQKAAAAVITGSIKHTAAAIGSSKKQLLLATNTVHAEKKGAQLRAPVGSAKRLQRQGGPEQRKRARIAIPSGAELIVISDDEQ